MEKEQEKKCSRLSVIGEISVTHNFSSYEELIKYEELERKLEGDSKNG